MTEQKQRMMLEEGLCKVTVKRKGEQGLKSVGIGINIGKQPLPLDLYKITALSPQGSAAETGRIKVGDIIHKVDGLPVKTLELAEMVEKIKGPVGTSVELLLQSEESFKKAQQRAINLESEQQALVQARRDEQERHDKQIRELMAEHEQSKACLLQEHEVQRQSLVQKQQEQRLRKAEALERDENAPDAQRTAQATKFDPHVLPENW